LSCCFQLRMAVCQVMFAELKLPVEFFGVVDLHGKPFNAI